MTGGAAPALDGAFVPRPAAGVHTLGTGSEAVLLDGPRDRVHLLNETAALLWACFDAEVSLGELATELAEELDVPFERIWRDVRAVVEGLHAEGLVEDGRLPPTSAAGDAAAEVPEPSGLATSGGLVAIPEPPNP